MDGWMNEARLEFHEWMDEARLEFHGWMDEAMLFSWMDG